MMTPFSSAPRNLPAVVFTTGASFAPARLVIPTAAAEATRNSRLKRTSLRIFFESMLFVRHRGAMRNTRPLHTCAFLIGKDGVISKLYPRDRDRVSNRKL